MQFEQRCKRSTGNKVREAQVPYLIFATPCFVSFIAHSFSGSSIAGVRFSTAYCFFSLHVLIDEMIAVAKMKQAMQVLDEMSGMGFPELVKGSIFDFCGLIENVYSYLHSERKVSQ